MADTPNDRLREALRAALDLDETFNQGPVGRILAQGVDGNYIVPAEQVPAHFFHSGATAADDIRAFLAAGGNINLLEDYAGYVLRTSGIIKPDSSVDIDALDGWMRAHAIAISVLPGFRKKLDDLVQAHYALKRAIEAREEARHDFFSKPGALFLNNDPITAVEKLFDLPFPAEAMRELIEQIGDNESVLNGLRKAVLEYIEHRIGTRIDQHPAFCDFLDRHHAALSLLFEAEGMNTLDGVAASLKREALSVQVHPRDAGPESPKNSPAMRRKWVQFFRRDR